MNHVSDIAGWPVVRRVIATVALGSLLAGCSLLAEPTPIMNYTCGTVPTEACHEPAQKVAAIAGGVVRSVAITCSARDCTRAWGEGDAAATLADGSVFHARWSYSGDPNPPPTPICIGLARDICTQRV